jgi:response regulator RpfG family c-di-GMP phosphodiesterase
MELSFIIVDDNELDCFIARKIIKHTDENLPIATFQDANKLIEGIRKNELNVTGRMAVILLDLKMPLMDGFEFVEEFEKLSPDIQNNYLIFVLSSTRNLYDIQKILSYETVIEMLEKPITKETFSALLLKVRSFISENNI